MSLVSNKRKGIQGVFIKNILNSLILQSQSLSLQLFFESKPDRHCAKTKFYNTKPAFIQFNRNTGTKKGDT